MTPDAPRPAEPPRRPQRPVVPPSGTPVLITGVSSLLLCLLFLQEEALFGTYSDIAFFFAFPSIIILGIISIVIGIDRLNPRSGIAPHSPARKAVKIGLSSGALSLTVLLLVFVGLEFLTRSTPVLANKDAIINDLNNIAAHTYQYKIRPASMGGGAGCYDGYRLPDKMAWNGNARYRVLSITCSRIVIEGVSVVHIDPSTASGVRAEIDQEGRIMQWTFFGRFEED